MLTRVADNLYWLSRYLERADQTARLLRVEIGALADRPASEVAAGWRRLFQSLCTAPPGGDELLMEDLEDNFLLADAYTLADFMTFDPDHPSSILSLWAIARENARQARQEITSEMWTEVNRTYLELRETNLASFWNAEPQNFYRETSAKISQFWGVTDSSLRHGLPWDFIRLGRYVERIQLTADILEAHRPAPEDGEGDLDGALLLRNCASFEPYCKYHSALIEPEQVMAFLIYEPHSPHALRFCAEQITSALRQLDPAGGAQYPLRTPHRLAGRIRSLLAFSPQDLGNVTEILTAVRGFSRELHDEIGSCYIYYPADQGLRSG